MAARWGARSRGSSADPVCSPKPVQSDEDAGRSLPRWMLLYFYGMHGVTLDVLLSSFQGILTDQDPKLLGFSSPYLCAMHSVTHFALEKVYSQKRSFRGRPVVFHLVFYPSVYIGLQILIGNVNTLTEQVRLVSGTQLLFHYILALYFCQMFHRGLSHLQYHHSCTKDFVKKVHLQNSSDGGRCSRVLPGYARFLFFGMHGFLDEVVFTSLFNLIEKSDRTLSGHTSLWSFFMYGSCSFVVEKIYLHLHFSRGWSAWQRLPIYICFIYTWEFTWGLVLRQFNACSWDYSHYPHNFMGLITLLYLPGWVCLSLYQDVLSNILLKITCKENENCGINGELNGHFESKKKKI